MLRERMERAQRKLKKKYEERQCAFQMGIV